MTLGPTVSTAVCLAGGAPDPVCGLYKTLIPEEYEGIRELLQDAKVALQDRDKKLAEAYEQIETDLVLLGATAVEDR